LKIPGVSEAIFQQYFDMCMELLHNANSTLIQSTVLNLVEVYILVFPKAISSKLQEVRDITRALLIDRNKNVYEAAGRVYPLIFRAVLAQNAVQFEDFLRNEINLLSNPSSLEAVGDPLISNLSNDELYRTALF
jgi:hypothetical protein